MRPHPSQSYYQLILAKGQKTLFSFGAMANGRLPSEFSTTMSIWATLIGPWVTKTTEKEDMELGWKEREGVGMT